MENLSPKHRKGIDVTVSILKKKYPFITGYIDDERKPDDYPGSFYITLKVEVRDVGKYLGFPMSEWWDRNLNKEYPDGYSTSAIGTMLDGVSYNSEDIDDNPAYILGREISDETSGFYSFLPEELKMQYQLESSYSPGTFYTYDVTLKAYSFLLF
jgi:hypothetical protein